MSNEFSSLYINAFLGASEFADEREEIGYLNAAGDDERTIQAFVRRYTPEPIGENPRNISPRIEVEVANDSTSGISSDEINRGGDKLNIALKKGGTAEPRVITQVLSQDAACLLLEVR